MLKIPMVEIVIKSEKGSLIPMAAQVKLLH